MQSVHIAQRHTSQEEAKMARASQIGVGCLRMLPDIQTQEWDALHFSNALHTMPYISNYRY